MMTTELMAVLEAGGTTGTCDDMTARKAVHMMNRDCSWVSGFVLMQRNGTRDIVEMGAVRRLTNDQMWELMHGKQ